MQSAWTCQYIGIPYRERGRGRDGADCWGLVRLVYAEQLGHALPGFEERYTGSQDAAVPEMLARAKEGWARRKSGAQPGDVVLFRVMGRLSHVGIVVAPGLFLHTREGYASVVERLDSGAWRHRVEGYYSYTGEPVVISACPHPLRTQRIDAAMPPGMTLAEVAQWIDSTPAGIDPCAVLLLDGQPIPAALWAETLTRPGQRIEYRALPRGGGGGRMLLMAVVTFAAIAIAPYLAPSLVTAMGAAGVTVGLSTATALTTAALSMAGTLLINSIFPVRQGASGGGVSITSSPLLQGGSNQSTPYGAIPVVLGRYRYTAPIGANTYAETNATTSYLRMLLVWGYGPLQVSDLRIGETPLDNFEEVEYETLTGLDDTAEDKAHFNSLYSKDVTQDSIGVTLKKADGYTERTIGEEVDRISINLHFPQGLFGQSGTSGNVLERTCSVSMQIRQIGTSSWSEVAQTIPSKVLSLPPAWYNTDDDAALEPVYRWTRISLSKTNQIIVRHGAFSASASAAPSGALLQRLQADNFGVSATFDRLPALGPEEEDLHQICIFGDGVYSVVDTRGHQGIGSVTGCSLAMSARTATLSAGGVTRAQVETYSVRKNTQTAFSATTEFYVPRGRYDVRVKRTNEFTGSNQTYDDCVWQSLTGFSNNKPIVPPKPMAMTALRIKATNQLNGSVAGISGTVQSICKDWDSASGTWIVRPTRNPASLLRHVLQHPANAQRILDSMLDLPALQSWHDYCRTNKFMFDAVLSQQKSLLDVLRDVAAAGRASPAIRDGLRTVLVDRPRTTAAQFFTAHNSWGFEGARALPVMPHAFRVSFSNAERGYQPDEMLVYNDGYSASNATLFEALTLPGVTTTAAVFKHARFHLAQLRLRPETYTLNADIEHLVCTRGDLVRVTHDVPMWGLGSGRIRERVSSTVLALDEAIPMDAGVQYTIRIRLEDGSSITRTIAAAALDGHYTQITLTSGVSAYEAAPGNLFLAGSLASESVELVVNTIEPGDNMTARITLSDYAPSIYASDTEVIPAFDSRITRPPVLLQAMVTGVPTIRAIVSDERVMRRIAPGKYIYAMRISFTSPQSLPHRVTHVEGQIDFVEDSTLDWLTSSLTPIKAGSVMFEGVQAGGAYRLRLRYVDDQGRTGPWTPIQTHTVVGKSNPPATPTGLTLVQEGTRLRLDWADNEEADIESYEVRTSDSGWGGAGFVFRGRASSCVVNPATAGTARTWYVKAIDGGQLYSAAPALIGYTVAAPNAPASAAQTITKVAAGLVTLSLDWPESIVPTSGFPVAGYELRTSNAGWGTAGYKFRGATSLCTLAGIPAATATTFYLKSFDVVGNYSLSALTVVHDVTAPVSMATATLAVTRVRATLSLALTNFPVRPSDFDCYEFRVGQVRSGATGSDDTPDAVVSGTTDNFWSDPDCQIVRSATPSASIALGKFAAPLYSAAGVTYRAACRMRDKSDNYSPASAISSITITKIS
jgi:predicted phage tail protein